MAKAFIDDTNLTDIANAIRATLDESRQYLPSEMAAAIDSIPIMAQLKRKKYFQAVPAGAASGYATIEQIEGNTVAWNQLVYNGQSERSATLDGTTSQQSIRGFQVRPITTQHVYLTFITAKSTESVTGRFYITDSLGSLYNITIETSYKTVGLLSTFTGSSASYINVSFRFTPNTTSTATLYTKDLIAYDLTAIFGAGNEPTTVADFEAWMAQNGLPSVADYNAGELLSVKMQSVRSVGFNQWDEVWEGGYINQNTGLNISGPGKRSKNYIQVLPQTQYYCKTIPSGMRVFQYDVNKSFINAQTTVNNAIFTTYSNAHYIRFQDALGTYNHDICINLSDPAKNGNYEPYQSDLADIDVTTITGMNTSTNVRETIFSNGMKQADREGTVKDTLDLRSDTATVSVGSRAYQAGDESDTDVLTDGTTTYYALTTPIEYTDLQDGNGNPLNPRYKVEQGGTEQVLPVNTSTPTTVAPTLTTTYTKDNN